MEETIYQNNEVTITKEVGGTVDHGEAKINVNGKNLIWISRTDVKEFQMKLSALLDNYRI